MRNEREDGRVRVAWIGIAAGFLVAYLTVVLPGERHASDLAFEIRELDERAAANEAVRAQLPEIDAARRRIVRDIAALRAQNNAGSAALAALRLLQRESRAHHVAFGSLTPEELAGRRGIQTVEMTLRGRYADVVQCVADISRGDVLAEIEGVELTGRLRDSGRAEVEAKLRASLYHGVEALEEDKHDATPLH